MLVKLDLSQVTTEVQYEFWQAVTPSAYRVGRVPNGNGLNAVASFWSLDGIMASRFAAGAHQINRGDKAAGRSRAPFVKVRLYHAGSAQLHDASGVHHLRPGDVHIIDQSRAWTARYEAHDQCSIFLPHDRIGYNPSEQPVVRTFPLASFDGRLLHFAIRDFYDTLERGERDTSGLSSVVEAVLHGAARMSQNAQFKAARDSALQFFAREVGIDEKLLAHALARDFGISRATVYRAFRDHGGLERFRMKARLDRAHDLLAGQEAPRGEIGRIASGYGFASTAHFSDAFLDRFGVRPSEAIKLSRPDATTGQAAINDPRDLEATMRNTRELYARMTG